MKKKQRESFHVREGKFVSDSAKLRVGVRSDSPFLDIAFAAAEVSGDFLSVIGHFGKIVLKNRIKVFDFGKDTVGKIPAEINGAHFKQSDSEPF